CPDSIDLKENGKINETDADLKRKNELDYTAELNKTVAKGLKIETFTMLLTEMVLSVIAVAFADMDGQIEMIPHQFTNESTNTKNAEYNVPAIAFGPIGLKEAFLDSIADCEVLNYSEDVNNSMDNNQSGQPSVTNRPGLGIQTLMPKHPQYATKIQRESSYNGWPNTSRHTPIELADAGFFFAGLRHWDKDDNVWIEHARWSKDCVFLLQKKGGPFVEL
ncbi:IAP3-like protein, partial [Mya arenaria]